jgi:thiamine-monophosphate kinase
MIDISDGLSSETLHLSKSSGVGMNIFADKIPIVTETKEAAEELGLEPFTLALNGGEDYELLFTVPLEMHEAISQMEEISIIGHVKDQSEGCHIISSDGSAIALQAMGWNGLSDFQEKE